MPARRRRRGGGAGDWGGKASNRNGPARLFQIACGDIAIAAIIARSRQDQGAARAEAGQNHTRHRPACRFHQGFSRQTRRVRRRIGTRHFGRG